MIRSILKIKFNLIRRQQTKRWNFSKESKLRIRQLQKRVKNSVTIPSWLFKTLVSELVQLNFGSNDIFSSTIQLEIICLPENHRARKAAFISFSLVLLNMLQGYVILQTYITDIVENSNPNISPIDASIIIVGMLIIANLVYVNLIDRAGRRVFYIFSSFATFVGHVLFALYLEFLAKNHEFDWVPIVCLSYVVFVTFLGLNPVPWLIMVEIFPKKVRPERSMPILIHQSPLINFEPNFSDSKLWIFHMRTVGADIAVHLNWNVSTNSRMRWAHRVDNILCGCMLGQCNIWNILCTGNERKISWRNHANVGLTSWAKQIPHYTVAMDVTHLRQIFKVLSTYRW